MIRYTLKSLFAVVGLAAVACWIIRFFQPFGILYAFLLTTACVGFVSAKRKRSHAALGGFALLIMGGFCLDLVINSQCAVSADRLQIIQAGATKAEVEALLGKPDRIRWRERDWIYSDKTWRKVTVRFSAQGKVDYVYHDR